MTLRRHLRPDEPAIEQWNTVASEPSGPPPGTDAETAPATLKQKAMERWENEGGEIPLVHSPRSDPTRDAADAVGKKLIIFDLDGTLAGSKSPIDTEMATLLRALLGIGQVAVISGGDWPQFETQLLANLPHDEHLQNLSLLPTCGTKYFRFTGHWEKIYSEDFTTEEKRKIITSFKQALENASFKVEEVWGESLEDRGSQITYSALGQQAPLDEKKKWDTDFTQRKQIKALLDKLIPEFSVRLGGTTSIDVTRQGIDKAYGIRKLRDMLGIAIDEMIFIGDALFSGGNDYPAQEAGVVSIPVRDPEETKRVIETIIACLGPAGAKSP
jgi:phosphomannomutase